MSIRPLRKTPEDVLNAFKEALQKPSLLTPEEEVEFLAFRARTPITVWTEINHAFVRKKNQQVVLRPASRKGADRLDTHAGQTAKEAERDFLTSQAVLFRKLTANEMGVKARKRNAAALKNQVLDLAIEHKSRGRNRAGLIANKLGVRRDNVRRIIKKNANLTEGD